MILVHQIWIFPIKSLDGCAVTQATFSSGGSFVYDREFALFGLDGRTVNAKKYPHIQKIRCHYNLEERMVSLSAPKQKDVSFHLDHQREELENWLSLSLQTDVYLRQNQNTGFPDDLERSGPTIVSLESLKVVSDWFQLPVEEIQRRFRTNIVLEGGGQAFWEDELFGNLGEHKPFRLGQIVVMGEKPCPRCPVPTRDALSGDADTGFQELFERNRAQTVLLTTDKKQFPHFYMMAVNTNIEPSAQGKVLKTGDLYQPM